jgi:hypothetical protein
LAGGLAGLPMAFVHDGLRHARRHQPYGDMLACA